MSGDCIQGHRSFLPLTGLDVVAGICNQRVCLISFLFMWLPVRAPCLYCNGVSSSGQGPRLYAPLLNALVTSLPSDQDCQSVGWLQTSALSSASLSHRRGRCRGCHFGAWTGDVERVVLIRSAVLRHPKGSKQEGHNSLLSPLRLQIVVLSLLKPLPA